MSAAADILMNTNKNYINASFHQQCLNVVSARATDVCLSVFVGVCNVYAVLVSVAAGNECAIHT